MIKKIPFSKRIHQHYLPKTMLVETRQTLLEEFKISNEKLAHFMSCDLSHWSN